MEAKAVISKISYIFLPDTFLNSSVKNISLKLITYEKFLKFQILKIRSTLSGKKCYSETRSKQFISILTTTRDREKKNSDVLANLILLEFVINYMGKGTIIIFPKNKRLNNLSF